MQALACYRAGFPWHQLTSWLDGPGCVPALARIGVLSSKTWTCVVVLEQVSTWFEACQSLLARPQYLVVMMCMTAILPLGTTRRAPEPPSPAPAPGFAAGPGTSPACGCGPPSSSCLPSSRAGRPNVFGVGQCNPRCACMSGSGSPTFLSGLVAARRTPFEGDSFQGHRSGPSSPSQQARCPTQVGIIRVVAWTHRDRCPRGCSALR